jgi:hypothetical protein
MAQLELKSLSAPVPVSSDRGAEPTTSSFPVRPLDAQRLYRPADLSALSFESMAYIEPADGLVGQQRALDAIEFGTRISKQGFNLFVIGPSGMRPQRTIERVLQDAARERRRPSDWVYVNNFIDPRKAVAIELPAGRAGEFRDGMHALIDDLKTALPAVFESEDYQTRRGAVDRRPGECQCLRNLAIVVDDPVARGARPPPHSWSSRITQIFGVRAKRARSKIFHSYA